MLSMNISQTHGTDIEVGASDLIRDVRFGKI